MMLRISTLKQRACVVAVAVLLTLPLGYFSIRNALATNFAAQQTLSGYQQAVRWEPQNPKNWYLLGHFWQYDFENGDLDRGIKAYGTALSLNPRYPDAWLDLGTAYETQGRIPEARRAFIRAAKAYPSSAEVAWRYGNFLFRQEELADAFAEFHAAVANDPKRAAEAFLQCLRVQPDVLKLLDQIIPPSREGYIDVIRALAINRQLEGALLVWDRLVALKPRIQVRDASDLFGALQQAGRHRQAKRVWDQTTVLAGFGDILEPPGSILWDGSFETGLTGWGYGWTYPAYWKGIRINQDSQEKHTGSFSLRLDFDAKAYFSFLNVCHRAAIEPAQAYQFSAWIRTDNLTTDEGVRLVLWARDVPDKSTLTTADVRGTQPWKELQYQWTSPPDGNELEVCVLRNASAQEVDKISGTAWIDDVSVVPMEHAKR